MYVLCESVIMNINSLANLYFFNFIFVNEYKEEKGMKLFEPIKIGNVELKNRVIMAPMENGMAAVGTGDPILNTPWSKSLII